MIRSSFPRYVLPACSVGVGLVAAPGLVELVALFQLAGAVFEVTGLDLPLRLRRGRGTRRRATDEPAGIPLDGHPTAAAMRAFGEDLAERLGAMEAAGFGA